MFYNKASNPLPKPSKVVIGTPKDTVNFECPNCESQSAITRVGDTRGYCPNCGKSIYGLAWKPKETENQS